MATIFLLLIYLAFIGLGLPDSILGAAWPVMRPDFGAALGAAGLLSMTISGGTIISSLASEFLVSRFGAGKITAVSTLVTALALLGFSAAPAFGWLIVLAVPLGLGAGAVDAALNNYVALHYEARHMSWLHCFWGVGAFAGPLVLALSLGRGFGWRGGYFGIGAVQLVIAILLLTSLPLWGGKRKAAAAREPGGVEEAPAAERPAKKVLKIPGVIFALLTFFFYCAAEFSAGLWSSSFLVEERGCSENLAAWGAAAFYGGITLGRFFNGFLSMRVSGPGLIRGGILMVMAGALLLATPLPGPVAALIPLVVGLGCAPVYPSMIHETPRRFGALNSQKIIGLQMATAYCGTTFLPPLLGAAAGAWGLWIFPGALFCFGLAMLLCSELCNTFARRNR